MNELNETWRWIIGGVLTCALAAIVWRFSRMEKEIALLWKNLGDERKRIDLIRESQHLHEKGALEERVKIERRFSEAALALSNVSGEVKLVAMELSAVKSIAEKIERKVNEIRGGQQ